MSAEDLLRAIGEIEDRFIGEAAPEDSLLEEAVPPVAGHAAPAGEDAEAAETTEVPGTGGIAAKSTADKQREQEKERRRRFIKPAGMLAACVILLLAYGICYSLGLFASFRKPSGAASSPAAADSPPAAAAPQDAQENAVESPEESPESPAGGEKSFRAKESTGALPEEAALPEIYENGDLPIDGNALEMEDAFEGFGEDGVSAEEDALAEEPKEEPSEEEDAPAAPMERENASMVNPFISCKNMREAAGIAGFTMAVPGSISSYRTQMIFAIHDYLIDVIYYDGQELEGLRIRKSADASGSISGDYTLYEKDYTVKITPSEEAGESAVQGTSSASSGTGDAAGESTRSGEAGEKASYETAEQGDAVSGLAAPESAENTGETAEIAVNLKGNGDRVYVAEWQKDGYAYAIAVTEANLDEEKMLELVREVG